MKPVDRLPPLNALRAFEAVARRLSFARAAEELHVTKAAVAQQVRVLEQEIGAPLVQRSGRGLALTESGAAGATGPRRGLRDPRPRRARDARSQGPPLSRHQCERILRRDLARRPDRQVQGAASRNRRAARRQSDARTRSNRARLTRSSAGARGTFPASPRRSCSRRTCFRSARPTSSPATIRCARPRI